MMRRWFASSIIGPAALGLALAGGSYWLALSYAPEAMMRAAWGRLAKGGFNVFSHAPLATAESRAIVRPSPDLAYTVCAFDVSSGPVRVAVPAIPALYWSLSVFQANTDAAFVRNNRDSGGQGFSVVVARDGQPVPAGEEVVRLPADKGVALIRVLVGNRAAFPLIDRARRQAVCRPV